jgi:hypothetical protein
LTANSRISFAHALTSVGGCVTLTNDVVTTRASLVSLKVFAHDIH